MTRRTSHGSLLQVVCTYEYSKGGTVGNVKSFTFHNHDAYVSFSVMSFLSL
jgi:hypothetical protein